ncbi:MAG: cell division protein SepF [Clostridia bacterium]|nr:cell division protein SepF [Clostridia bacterium]
MSAFINKMLTLAGFEPDEDESTMDGVETETLTNKSNEGRETMSNTKKNSGKLVNLSNANQLKLVVMQPTSYEDARDICDHLKAHKPVVINLEYTDKATATRIIDFLSGSVCAVDGTIQKVSATIFLIAPYNVDIMSDETEDKNKGSFAWIK